MHISFHVVLDICLFLQELGLIRKPASFMTSICDERGEELNYAGVPITKVLEQEMGIGGVLGLLWFQVIIYSKITLNFPSSYNIKRVVETPSCVCQQIHRNMPDANCRPRSSCLRSS